MCEPNFPDRSVQKNGTEYFQPCKSSLQILTFTVYTRGIPPVQLLEPSADLPFRGAIKISHAIRI